MSHISSLLEFIKKSPSPFHVIRKATEVLGNNGFEELKLADTWRLQSGKAYMVSVYDSTLIAFTIGAEPCASLRLAAAHTDFPCLRIKPNPDLTVHGYRKVNVEVYGGMIRESWLDRPLSAAGKLTLCGSDAFQPRTMLIDIGKPFLTIPRLAIHMNPKTNDGLSLNPQKEMLPLMGTGHDESDFLTFMSGCCGIPKEEIVSYDLTVYPTEHGTCTGCNDEFLSSPRLDNLTSVKACLEAISSRRHREGIRLVALFDNEEVGNHTKQGAASSLLPELLQRIYLNLGFTYEDYMACRSRGFLLSLDVAHGMHPNYPEKNDITNFPLLNGGPVLKTACSQRYAGDAEAAAVIIALCRREGIPLQYFVNRSDMSGGSTLGSVLSAHLAMRAMDVGLPVLAMHSARELMGGADQTSLEKLTTAFLQS